MQSTAKITSKGQITVPHEIRHLLGVRPGDSLIFERRGSEIHVVPQRAESPFAPFRGIGTPKIGKGREAVIRAVREMRDGK